MKKLKFMLLSFALLAVIGGALAFKAKFQVHYCTTLTNGLLAPNNVCTIIGAGGVKLDCDISTTSTTIQAVNVFCTTKDDDDGVFDCRNNGGDFLKCNTTTKLKID